METRQFEVVLNPEITIRKEHNGKVWNDNFFHCVLHLQTFMNFCGSYNNLPVYSILNDLFKLFCRI